MIGKLHSYESCGTVDGPGLRYVVFMQGCPLRCKYCHNPDTWDIKEQKISVTADKLMKEIKKYENFFKKTGGVTFTGGEPFLQAEFLKEALKRCKDEGYHTTVDTSGFVFNDMVKDALKEVDLILLDIKSINPKIYLDLTEVALDNTLKLAEYASEEGIAMWIRHVLIPEWTDNDEDLNRLAEYITTLKTVEKIELLPYHKMGEYKWESMGKEYPLKGAEPPALERVTNAKEIFINHGLKIN